MEDAGAAPAVIHQKLALDRHPLNKKRGLPLDSSSSASKNSLDTWNPKCWSWDSTGFIASSLQGEGAQSGTGDQISAAFPRNFDRVCDSVKLKQPNNRPQSDQNQHEKLGDGDEPGNSFSNDDSDPAEEPEQALKPSKRLKTVSSGGSDHPICQVDDCNENLSSAKDYHRRHKVCEIHSKATSVLVGKQMQRFCQQCSRFHPLLDFDEGKRSCRRRLAGHNRRRRKNQPEDTTTLHGRKPGSQPDYIHCGRDIISLLSVLARGEGTAERMIKFSRTPEKDHQVQVLRQTNPLPSQVNLPAKPALQKTIEGIVRDGAVFENQNQMPQIASFPSTRDFLGFLSSGPAARSSCEFGFQSLPSTRKFDFEKSKSTCREQVDHQRSTMELAAPGGGRSNANIAIEMCDSFWLRMSSSSPEDTTSRELPSTRNITSSNSSNHSEEMSLVSSPPLQELFPLQASRETWKDNDLSKGEDKILCLEKDQKKSTCLQLFGRSFQAAEDDSVQSSSCRAAGSPSTSGSDQSPCSINSDVQRSNHSQTVRQESQLFACIIACTDIQLAFEKSFRHGKLHHAWVCNSIFYLSMPSSTWDQLEEKFSDYVNSLVKDIDMDFWGNGRFLVSSGSLMVSLKDGEMHLRKTLKTPVAPNLICVSPLAVVYGQETSLVLRGRNLRSPGTMVHCTHTDEFSVQEVTRFPLEDNAYDEIRIDGFMISSSTCNSFGRCFIEVDCTSRGFSHFPVIIADQAICHELKLLEPELHVEWNKGKSYHRKQVLHFLNELGWLFQRKSCSSLSETPETDLRRLKSLLIFCVEHDFCALGRTLLDILQEFEWETLLECHLLNRAVKRECLPMVNLLINYSLLSSSSGIKKFIFTPNSTEPGGVTPLHLAACASSQDLVDTLTNDPQGVGLQIWNSILDENGHSPYEYAAMSNNHSYNALVSQKLSATRNNDQVSVLIPEKITTSCSKCTIVAATRYHGKPRGILRLPYMHSMLVAVAAVCACVCIILRVHVSSSQKSLPFAWENLNLLSS